MTPTDQVDERDVLCDDCKEPFDRDESVANQSWLACNPCHKKLEARATAAEARIRELEARAPHGAAEERAAVVAWLRSDEFERQGLALRWAADAIDRGDHLLPTKEPTP